MTFCGKCGTKNPSDNSFCYNCGARLIIPGGSGLREAEEVVRIRPGSRNDEEVVRIRPGNREPEEAERIGPYQKGRRNDVPPAPEDPWYNEQPQERNYRQYQKPAGAYRKDRVLKVIPFSKPKYLQGSPSNDVNLRWISIGLSAAAFALTLIALFGITFDNGEHTYTLFGIGSEDGAVMSLILSVLTLIVSILALFVPILCIPSGLLLMGSAVTACSNNEYCPDSSTMIVFILMGVAIIALGFIATKFVRMYAVSNAKNLNLFECCLMSWFGPWILDRMAEQAERESY